MASYTFNTRVVFLLGKFLKHFEGNIDELTKIVQSNGGYKLGDDVLASVGPEKFLQLLFQVVASASEAEDTAVKLLAVASRRSELEVRDMDGHEFIKEMREFLTSINWDKLMGESLGLVPNPQDQSVPTESQKPKSKSR